MNASELPESPYKRILFCTDFSENAGHAFDYALDAVRRRPGSTLYLLHVIPEPEAQFWKTYLYEVDEIDNKAKQDIDAKIAETYLPRVPEGVDFQVEMRIGKEAAEILEFARKNRIDLIVIGRQGGSALGDMLFGTITEKVVRRANCPVLVVPMRREKEDD